MDGWLIALLVVLAYGALLIILGQTNLFARAGIESKFGLMIWRTARGRALLDRLARARRLWGAFGRFSVVLVFFVMGGMVVTLLFQLALITSIPANAVEPQYVIGIPGVNPLIPVGFGIVGLAIAIVVHEGCHGILARVEGIKVRSVGLLIAVFPIGAFVEPDEGEMRAASLPKRQRIYGVGPASNIVLALVCAGIFSAGFMGSLQPIDDGAVITTVIANSAAANASLQPYTLIDEMEFNGVTTDIHSTAEFEAYMLNMTPGNSVTLHTIYMGQPSAVPVVLGARPTHVAGRSDAVLGVIAESPETFTTSARPGAAASALCSGQGRTIGSGCYAQTVALYLGMPLRGESPAPAARQALYHPTGILAGFGGAFWVVADMFYWLFWLNFMVGTFNALPMKPLDGGHMFQDGVLSLLRRRAGAAAPAEGDHGDARRRARIEGIEADLEMMVGNARRSAAVRDELRASMDGAERPSSEAKKELADAEREATETESEVQRLAEQLEIERGTPATPQDKADGPAPGPAPADDLFGPRRFRDALDRRAHAITMYTSVTMLVLILLPFVVPRLLGTGSA